MPGISELLDKYFHGRCTEQEAEIVRNWLLDPKNEALTKALMQRQWESLTDSGVEADVESLLSRTKERLRPLDSEITPKSPADFPAGFRLGRQTVSAAGQGGKSRWFETLTFRVAASIALIVTGAVAVAPLIEGDAVQEITRISQVEEVRTSQGQIILKVLPDGTKVWLNAQSTLEYPATFGSTREVTLEGEAYFDVVEDPAHPFIVHADDIDIRVLGTAFNIKSYPGDPSIATTLVRGKVRIQKDEDETQTFVELKPNQQALFSHDSKAISLHQVNAERYTSWTNGTLVFEDDKVYDVFKTLERWYGVEINVQDTSNLSCRLTARIDKETISETLELLQSITGIQYTISDNVVTIKGRICTP